MAPKNDGNLHDTWLSRVIVKNLRDTWPRGIECMLIGIMICIIQLYIYTILYVYTIYIYLDMNIDTDTDVDIDIDIYMIYT